MPQVEGRGDRHLVNGPTRRRPAFTSQLSPLAITSQLSPLAITPSYHPYQAEAAVFVDLGSGVGRLVAQARLELPPERMARCVGVELSPSRHDLATSGWASLTADGAAAGGEEAAGVGALELRCESMPGAGLGEVGPMQARCRPDAGLGL